MDSDGDRLFSYAFRYIVMYFTVKMQIKAYTLALICIFVFIFKYNLFIINSLIHYDDFMNIMML